jgi:hypothetical protein
MGRRKQKSRKTSSSAGLPDSGARLSPFGLAAIFPVALAAMAFLPRVRQNDHLFAAVLGSAAALMALLIWVWVSTARTGRTLHFAVSASPTHYVQMAMHSSIYAYWGWYWPEVYSHIPLILAQVIFVYGLDMLLAWSHRDEWTLGFGPFPIVLSTNLFLWFRDDWFWLQFAMVALGVVCKEFIRWKRDGRGTHIFNPSAIALFVFSIALLLTNSTNVTWGPEISKSLHRPPLIYPEIFVLGLVVQSLFSVTLMTLSAAAALWVLNLAYTHVTGVYQFVDSNIPVSVFIGLHLLFTDPATSPRRATGRIAFGTLYGIAVFGLYSLLGYFEAPQFYDKLLCVPVLNLMVRVIDRGSAAFARRFHPFDLRERWGDRNLNFAHMGIWIALFAFMMATGFMGGHHPGESVAFWRSACDQNRYGACKVFVHALRTECSQGVAQSCLDYGKAALAGRSGPPDRLEAGKAFARSCDSGNTGACMELGSFTSSGGTRVLDDACGSGRDPAACYVSGTVYATGRGVAPDQQKSLADLRKACDAGFPRACGRIGQSYFMARGVEKNAIAGAHYMDIACSGGDAPSCYAMSLLFLRGNGVRRDAALAEQRMQQACKLGMQPACILADPKMAGLTATPAPLPVIDAP